MNPINLVVTLLFALHVVRATLYSVYLWQLKEYRFDRMWVHVNTYQGKRWVASPFGVIGWALLILYLFGLTSAQPLALLFGLELLVFLRNPIIKKPVFTTKARTLVAIGIVTSSLVIFTFGLPLYASLLLFDKLRAATIAQSVFILNRITNFSREKTITKARQKINANKDLKRIGITGSYGKSSTKEFLATILAQKYKVSKTPSMVNTDIGVAQSILDTLQGDHEIFVAEMGAYKVGEIAQIASIVQPEIGIITGINEQHLDLFGTLTNTRKAKFELIESLPDNGHAIFNGDDENTHPLIKKARNKKNLSVIIYGFNSTNDVYATDIVVDKNSVAFTLMFNKKRVEVLARVLGRQFIPNILAAAAVSSILGLTNQEISSGINQITSPQMTMAKAGEYKGAVLIDDTFNANPAGVNAAIDYMQVYAGKKILVLSPLIELGDGSKRIHQEIGKYASEHSDYIILTNKNYLESFTESVAEKKKNNVIVLSVVKTVTLLQENLTKDSVIVFEGKEAKNYLQQLKDKS